MMEREDMTAAYVYRLIQHETNLSEFALCVLHKPCRTALRCAEPQHTGMLNFDQVKEIWNALHPDVETPASVDGLTYKDERLCMVEIKGGVDFLRHEPLANKIHLTEKQVEIFQDKIVRKIGKFDFRNESSVFIHNGCQFIYTAKRRTISGSNQMSSYPPGGNGGALGF